ncbi:SseB protein N-terminal domain-containing protein [Actinoplanes derwentensis]|uniref:SseB protein N-terminal domain-containing protein n=1 Tax=Actinoplanes derwentensis TaxID=113562 RepID=A0A1H1UV06_9ACTN|nr:SseB protein N-terminal domain-containing protein [Actinoplanes derwentensis]
MPFPGNVLEAVLFDVWRGMVPPEALLMAVADHPVWVPLPERPDGSGGGLPGILIDGAPYIAVYTSVEQLAVAGVAELRRVRLNGRQLSSRTAQGSGFAVNPGCRVGMPLPAAAVDQLRGPQPGQERGPRPGRERRVRLRHPHPPPRELLNALIAEFHRTPAVLEARIVLSAGDDEPGTLVVGIRPDRGIGTWLADSRDAVRRASRTILLAYTVDGLFLDEPGGVVVDWMIQETEPFYRRW